MSIFDVIISRRGKNLVGMLKTLRDEQDLNRNPYWDDVFELLEDIDKRLFFVEHLEAHPEVQKAPKNAGKPMCKICEKTMDEIYEVSADSSQA